MSADCFQRADRIRMLSADQARQRGDWIMRRCSLSLSTFLRAGLFLAIVNSEYVRSDVSILTAHVRPAHCASDLAGKSSCFTLAQASEDCPTGNGRGKKRYHCK
jgi:hypothetical protein